MLQCTVYIICGLAGVSNALNCIQIISRQWTHAASIKSGSDLPASLKSFPWPPPKAKSDSNTDSAFLLLELFISKPTFNKRMAVIQQVLVCSSSAQSSFKSRAELHFVDWGEKLEENKTALWISVHLLLLYSFGMSLFYSNNISYSTALTFTQKPNSVGAPCSFLAAKTV